MLFKSVKSAIANHWLQISFLLLSMIIGGILRFTNLTGKTIWSDEFSTIVFGLGNSFKTMPLDRIVDSDTLLKLLTPNSTATVKDTVYNLFTESTHPPLYFILTHWWLNLFPSKSGLVSLWAARSLSAFLGIMTITATFGFSWLVFRSLIAAQLSAMLMAASPFGVYLSQEARHYTLAILWVIASLCCLVLTSKYLLNGRKIPIALSFLWIATNALGIATHYFFAINLGAETIAIIWLWWQSRTELLPNKWLNWGRICLVGLGTLVSCLVWIPIWQNFHDRDLTSWVDSPIKGVLNLLEPMGQLLAAAISMLVFLPVEEVGIAIAIPSGIIMVIVFGWSMYLCRSLFQASQTPGKKIREMEVLITFVAGAIAIFLVITYTKFSDLLSGIRYNFVYFPAFIVIVSGCLALSWYLPNYQGKFKLLSPKSFTYLLVAIAIVSSFTVVSGLSFQKPYRPDLFLNKIRETSQPPFLITTTYHQHNDISKMMGLAWEIKRQKIDDRNFHFLLINNKCRRQVLPDCLPIEKVLSDRIQEFNKPLDLWVINYPSLDINLENLCHVGDREKVRIPGFRAKLYHCSRR